MKTNNLPVASLVKNNKKQCNILLAALRDKIGVALSGTIYDYGELTSESRLAHIVKLRNTLFYFLYFDYKLNFSEIGSMYGRCHSTVIHSLETVKHDFSLQDPIATDFYDTLKALNLKYLSKTN